MRDGLVPGVPGVKVVGAHNVGSMVPVFVDSALEAARHREHDETTVTTDERCGRCSWHDVCEGDRTCWLENERLARAVR